MEAEAQKKKIGLLALLFLCLGCAAADAQQWERIPDFDLTRRIGAVAFSWRGKGYVGFGHDYNSRYPFNDLTSYDTLRKEWEEVSWLDSGFRTGAFSFLLNDQLYIGGGTRDSAKSALRDFYRYDLAERTWTRLHSLPFEKAVGARAVLCDRKAYLLGGCITGSCDSLLWKYDVERDEWTHGQLLPARNMYAIAFSLRHEIYYGLGSGADGRTSSQIWKINPDSSDWQQVRSFTAHGRNFAVSISMDSVHAVAGLGFLYNDYQQEVYLQQAGAFRSRNLPETAFMKNDLWIYSAVTGNWKRLPLMKLGRRGAICFVLDPFLYVGMGNTGGSINKDMYRLDLSSFLESK